ncbi:hypothetical protein GGX14DRAFT_471732 [Mycena pura]|uniref:Uncharacterized protein n=1 Tax=Mycena pura TaxID=153505 RepID=A0AAD6UXN5_9AGAR|nr:hypothetical protein GGX14DRAFT_471732 [Mycena pura]
MNHDNNEYLAFPDLSLRCFDADKCWPLSQQPWQSLLAPYPLLFPDQPPSPTDTCASFSSTSSCTPPPRPTHVVCNAPLVAPIPLPYHSPRFLQFELLPDIDEDLSRPPYTTRSRTAALKRKRTEDDSARQQKRRLSAPALHPPAPHAASRTRSSARTLPYQPRR